MIRIFLILRHLMYQDNLSWHINLKWNWPDYPQARWARPPPSEPGAIALRIPPNWILTPYPPPLRPNLDIASLVDPLTRSPMGELYPGRMVPYTSILFLAHLLTIRERQKSGSGISNTWFRITEYLDGDTKNICIFMTTSLDPWY